MEFHHRKFVHPILSSQKTPGNQQLLGAYNEIAKFEEAGLDELIGRFVEMFTFPKKN